MIKKILDFVVNFFKTRLHLKILAVLFAFLVWCYVIAGTNPTRSKDVADVSLSMINTEELTAKGLTIDTALSDLPETVDIKIEANVESHKNISADTIRATVNLAEINSIGDATLNITATSAQSGVNIKNIMPSRVTLRVDELVSREIPVMAQLTGEEQAGYYVSMPHLSKNTVVLSGPKKKISQIARAVCEIPVDDLTKNTRASYMLTLYDEEDEVLEFNGLTGEIPAVIADVTVLPSKMVAIKMEDVIAAVTNIKPGYEITGAVIEPSTVEIAAEQEVLDSITSLRVQPINAEEADKSVMIEAELLVPEGIEYISRSSVEILVQINEIQAEKTFKNHKIELKNLEEGLTAALGEVKYADVTVTGGKSAVDAVAAENVKLYVDMANITKAGVYPCKIEIEEIPGIAESGIAISIEEVNVTVKK